MQVKYDLLGNDKGQETDHIPPGKRFGLKGNNNFPTMGTIEFMSVFNFKDNPEWQLFPAVGTYKGFFFIHGLWS